jgi:hypothetical protein
VTEASTAAPRVATLADVPAIVRVINRAYRVEDFFVDGDRTDDADIRARLSNPAVTFLVIDDPAPEGEPGRRAVSGPPAPASRRAYGADDEIVGVKPNHGVGGSLGSGLGTTDAHRSRHPG